MARTRDKRIAIEMRRTGNTYSQIRKVIPNLAKSTLSNWIRNIQFSKNEELLITQSAQTGREHSRLLAAQTNRLARISRTKIVEKEAEIEFRKFVKNPLFTTGLALYWAEGAKRSSGAEIINSDYLILRIAIKWAERFLRISKKDLKTRLYIHRHYNDENLEVFWMEILGLSPNQLRQTIFKKTEFEFKKNPEYKGCLRVHLGGVNTLRKIFHWQKILAEHLKVT